MKRRISLGEVQLHLCNETPDPATTAETGGRIGQTRRHIRRCAPDFDEILVVGT